MIDDRREISVRARAPADGTPIIDFEADILFQNTPIGKIRLGLSTRGELSVVRTTWWLMALLATITIASVVCMLYVFGSVLTRPLRTLGRSMAVFSGSDLDHRVSSTRSDEIGELYAAFNNMADTLQQRFQGTTAKTTQTPQQPPRQRTDTTVVYKPGSES